MQTTRSTPKKPWAAETKLLISEIGVIIALCIGVGLWWNRTRSSPPVTVPMPVMPKINAFDDFIAAGKSYKDDKKISAALIYSPIVSPVARGSSDYSLGQQAGLVAENAMALRMLRQGFVYPYQNPPCRSFSTSFHYYVGFRGCARLLALQAQVETEQGNYSAAEAASLDAVQEGMMIPHGSTLIGMLVGIACQAIGRDRAWKLIDHLSASQAEASARRMERLRDMDVPLANTLREEKWDTQASLMEIFRHPNWTDLIDSDAKGLTERLQSLFVLNLLTKRTIMSDYTAYMNQSIHCVSLPYDVHRPIPHTRLDIVSQMLVPVTSQAQLKALCNETQNALLTVTLALRAYRLEHGACPAMLTSLVPTYLSRIPDDPFAPSGPLHYKRSGGKYVLYSVGPDGKDDGGKPIFDATMTAPTIGERDQRYITQADSRGDIVAGVNPI